MRTLVIVAHPDDDVIGCGALLAQKFEHGDAVRVVYVTDGAASHPHSRMWPPSRIAQTREIEACEAIDRLGGDPLKLSFLRVADGTVASLNGTQRAALLSLLQQHVAEWTPAVTISHWRRDPHPDHSALSGIVREAIRSVATGTRLLEFPVWLKIRGLEDDDPAEGEIREISFECSPKHYNAKRHALLAHRTQTTQLIDDDPTGFMMPQDLIDRFCSNTEVFYEVK